jgi:serine/threonine protein kinase
MSTIRSANASASANTSANKNSSNNNHLSKSMMKLLPHRRRQSKTVKQTAVTVDDYTNLLRRNSNYLFSANSASDGTLATLSSHTASDHMNVAPDFTNAAIASLNRREIQLGSLLGKGAFNKVYEVQDIQLGTHDNNDPARAAIAANARSGRFCLKRLKQRLTRGSPNAFTTAAANLMMEAQFLGQLDHPHILKLRGTAFGGSSSFATGHHDSYFLILDRLSETLEQRIHSTWNARRDPHALRVMPLNESALMAEKAQYALQLASALTHLHERRIVFRDMKPANVGFQDKTTLQLFDFGLARELPTAMGLPNELFHMTQHAGTRPYTAVEVATTGLYNDKADVYSWAMVVYEMMTEQLPFTELASSTGEHHKNKHHKLKHNYSHDDFVRAVFCNHVRPSFARTKAPVPVPATIQGLLNQCWRADLFVRPTMQQASDQLQRIIHTELLQHAGSTTFHRVVTAPTEQQQKQQQQQELAECSDMSNNSSN